MVVSENGYRDVYSARLKGSASNRQMRAIEAFLYRESCLGRIAAMFHNNASLFPSRFFTVVMKETFRSPDSIVSVKDSLQLYDEGHEFLREGLPETRVTRMSNTPNIATFTTFCGLVSASSYSAHIPTVRGFCFVSTSRISLEVSHWSQLSERHRS